MSVKVMGRVWDAELAPNHKLVLLAYADAAEHDGTQSYPGWERLCYMTGYSASQIQRITNDLIKAGVLTQVAKGRKGQRAEYQVNLEKLATQNATLDNRFSDASEPDDALPPVLPVLPIRELPNGSSLDELKDTLVELFGEPPPQNWSLYNRIATWIRDRGGTPDEIRFKAARIAEEWGVKAATPAALEKHWTRYDAEVGQLTEEDVERYQTELRRLQRQRRAEELDAAERGLPG